MRTGMMIFLFVLVSVLVTNAQYDTTDNTTLALCKKVSDIKQLCSVERRRYTFCELPASCNIEMQQCSDNSFLRSGYTKPILIPEESRCEYLIWGVLIVIYGFLLILWQKNNQPFRTRNIYLHFVEILSQFTLVRGLMGQSETDPCFMTASICLVCMVPERFGLLAQIEDEKRLAKVINALCTDNVPVVDIAARQHWLDSILGAAVFAVGHIAIGVAIVFFLTDIPFAEFEACNWLPEGYPGVSEYGFIVTFTITTIMVSYAMYHPETLMIMSIQIEFFLIVLSTIIGIALFAIYVTVYTVDKTQGVLITGKIVFILFEFIFAYTVSARCLVPTVYNVFFYKPRSVVDDDIRDQFTTSEKQQHVMKKLMEQATSELEMESLLLFCLLRSLLDHRQTTSGPFERCERLATMVFDNYISSSRTRKTLDTYRLRDLVENITSPLELLEKEVSVLVELDSKVRERIVLPMYARMIRQNNSSKFYS